MEKRTGVDQFVEFVAAVVRGVPRKLASELMQYWIENQESLATALNAALGAKPVVVTTEGRPETLIVQPLASLFTQLLAACKQDWVNPDVNESHFPLVDDGTKGKVEEYCFNRDISGTEVESELKELGFKLVGMRRAMEYIAAHPDIQLDHPVVVLGARWQRPDGSVYVPYFFRHGGWRYLGLRWLDDAFRSNCRFLVSRE